MTRDDVIRALEICTGPYRKCDGCPLLGETWCNDVLDKAALTLLIAVPKRGRWIIGDNGEWACSGCGYEPVVFENTPFCANCGTRMCDAKKKEGRA